MSPVGVSKRSPKGCRPMLFEIEASALDRLGFPRQAAYRRKGAEALAG
jgi:hypothetical protein